ncbi:MAG: biopolymer transporter ExbD [Phycisphaerales bacterium]|nr:MAG: biopolymer transporter ExbD [Phycisphaerales bacterium]
MLIKAQESTTSPSIELTPLIDMVFLLLIFFLVATTFHQTEREMQIALPVANSAGPISASLRELIVNVDVEGRIIVGGRTITPDEFGTLVGEAVELNPQQKVTVRGDRGTAYANVVTVLDICKAAGIQEPYLDTIFDP